MKILTDGTFIYGIDDGNPINAFQYIIMDAPDAPIDSLYISHGEVEIIPDKPESAIAFDVVAGVWIMPPSVAVSDTVTIPLEGLLRQDGIQEAIRLGSKDSVALTLLICLLGAFVLKDREFLEETYSNLNLWLNSNIVEDELIERLNVSMESMNSEIIS